jgi:hypothetical protein
MTSRICLFFVASILSPSNAFLQAEMHWQSTLCPNCHVCLVWAVSTMILVRDLGSWSGWPSLSHSAMPPDYPISCKIVVVPYNRSCWRQESYCNIHGGKILKGIQWSPQPCPVRRQSPYAHISFRSCWWSIYYWHQLYTLVKTLFHYRRMSYLYSISDLRMTMRQMMDILTWIHY